PKVVKELKPIGLNAFRSRDLMPASAMNTAYVELKQPKDRPIILVKTDNARWRFEQPDFGEADYEGEAPAFGGVSKKITGVRELIDDIGGLRAQSETDLIPP